MSGAELDHPALSMEFVVRFLAPDGRFAGLGVLVGNREIVTCAHVVNIALARDRRSQGQPSEFIAVDFPLLPGSPLGLGSFRAQVACWRPPPRVGTAGDDIAGLVLVEDSTLPVVSPARLAANPASAGCVVSVFGYPKVPSRAEGGFVEAVVRGVIRERIQLDSTLGAALRIQPGYSGSPVYDREAHRVIGILAAAPTAESGERDSWATSATALRQAWPEVLDPRSRLRERAHRPATGVSTVSPAVTCLHLSDLRVGRPGGSEGTGPSSADDPDNALLRLNDDLLGLIEGQGIRPDMIVVTGNLTESALPSQFDRAMGIISSLADVADLPRDHIAIVPGSRDVNRQACAAYFLRQEAEEAIPVPPYWPKWENYAAAFNQLYLQSPGPTFTPDEPWTVFEIPDVKAVVAGLNSTILETHLEDGNFGAVGEDQLRWFADRLAHYKRRGWLRLVALHHDISWDSPGGDVLDDISDLNRILGVSELANLFMSGRTPNTQVSLRSGFATVASGEAIIADGVSYDKVLNQYQIIKFQADGFTRYARRYDRDAQRWVGDNRPSSDDSDWLHGYAFDFPELGVRSVPDERGMRGDDFPAPHHPVNRTPTPSEEFFERVVEATRVSLPSASITPRPESDYLRVSVPLGGGGCEQWPVGVLTKITEEAVTDFRDRVHSLFRAADPQVRSQLIYFGEPAPEALITMAREGGVRLRSFVDYSGLIDLQPFERAQSDRLSADVIYPESGYVAQRFRLLDETPEGLIRQDILGQLVKWLSVDGPRFIMLLGGPGRGKTYLLRQLTRRLPEKLPGILPILLELRNLEKAPTLDALLAQHLYRHQVEGITEAKLRFIVSSGRVVILCDGFDELELRVGYENAADYLQTLLGAVTDHAKVVVSSRTEHFRSEAQVSAALGAHIAPSSTNRVVSIEDFTEEQILEVLTTLYDGDQEAAKARFRLLGNISDLVGLSHNPRMLSFIAALPDEDLRSFEQTGGQLSGAWLYEALVNRWLLGERERHLHPGGLASLEVGERREACTALALRLWASGEPTFPIAELSMAVARTLTGLLDRGYTTEEAIQEVGSGTLLVRTEDGAFSFVHRSIMEWLVARAATDELEGENASQILESRRFSGLMINFLCDLAGHETARRWAASILREPGPNEAAKQNALAVNGRLKVGVRKQLAGVDLRGQDLTGWDLGGADLRSATLRGMQIVDANFRGADLCEADFTGARLTTCDLDGAIMRGSVWDRAALVGVSGLGGLLATQELIPAAIASRDPAEPMVGLGGPALAVAVSHDGALAAVGRRGGVELDDLATGQTVRVLSGHTGQVWGLAFSHETGLLATGSTDGSARIWEATTGRVKQLLDGHSGPVWDVAFSRDERLVATASHDHTVRVWDTATGRMQTDADRP